MYKKEVDSSGNDKQVNANDTEVSSKNGRRRFTATYKTKIVREADICASRPGHYLLQKGFRRDY